MFKLHTFFFSVLSQFCTFVRATQIGELGKYAIRLTCPAADSEEK